MTSVEEFLEEKFLEFEKERFIIAYVKFINCENKVEERKSTQNIQRQGEWLNTVFKDKDDILKECGEFLTRKTQIDKENREYRIKDFFESSRRSIIEFKIAKGSKFLVKRQTLSINSLFCPDNNKWFEKITSEKPFYILVSYDGENGFKLKNVFTGKNKFVKRNDLKKQKSLYGTIPLLNSPHFLEIKKELELGEFLDYHSANRNISLLYDPSKEPLPKMVKKVSGKRKRNEKL